MFIVKYSQVLIFEVERRLWYCTIHNFGGGSIMAKIRIIFGGLVLFSFFFVPASKADEPVCPAQAVKDPSRWDKSVAAGFNLTDGNSDTVLGTLGAKLSRDFEKNIWRFEASGNYGESDAGTSDGGKEKTKQDLKLEAEYKRLLSDRVFVGFGNTYLYDDIADIDYRLTLSPLAGYFLVHEDNLKLSVEAGPSYIFERVGGMDDDYLAPRIAERVEWKFSETGKFFHSAEAIFDVNDSENTLVNGEVGLEAALDSSLSLVLKITDKYDNVPAANLERNDLGIISALQVSL